ncbi:hypothetical protein [Cronobacter sakazakii]|uniref:hypothetical protein n=1 Tax=Cronobacter sakazakii TaxID=28141 RepID=UPI001F23A307|nr:hypothetical protein [Cronobacter sakazakii]
MAAGDGVHHRVKPAVRDDGIRLAERQRLVGKPRYLRGTAGFQRAGLRVIEAAAVRDQQFDVSVATGAGYRAKQPVAVPL